MIDNQATELFVQGDMKAIYHFQRQQNLRKTNNQIDISEIKTKFSRATGSEPTFQLLCKSLGPVELGLILHSSEISEKLKDTIVSRLDAYHSKFSRVMIVAECYKKNK